MQSSARVAVRASVRMTRWWIRRKRYEINPPFDHHLVGHESHLKMYWATYLMTLTHFLKVKYSNPDHLSRLNVAIS